jgi:zinc transport system ATP-binding protein
MADKNIITFENVYFSYNKAPVLENVSFQVKELSSVCILGPNGGGKSTLLKLILGLIKPVSGKIRVLGAPPEKVRRRIGYMPQYTSFDPFFPIRVMDIVLMGRLEQHWLGAYSRKDKEAAWRTLELLSLEDVVNKNFSSLSGGQRQRVLIARALASEPEILLLDEPTANIDPGFEIDLQKTLEILSRKVTILTVSHDVGFVSKQYKNVLCVNRTVIKHPTGKIKGEMIYTKRFLGLVHSNQ